MARLITDGFEGRSNIEYTCGGNGSFSISTAQANGGSRSLSLYGSYINYPIPSLTEGFVRVSLYPGGGTAPGNAYLYVRLLSGTTLQGYFAFERLNGRVAIFNAAGTLLSELPYSFSETWYMCEVHWSNTVQQLRVNGTTLIDYSGSGISSGITTVQFYNVGVPYATVFLDDIAINSTSGTTDNSWCGGGKVFYVPVGSDITAAWTRSSGASSYALLDEVPFDGTDYVRTTVAGTLDEYGLGNYSAISGKAIKRVWIEADAIKEDYENPVGVVLGVQVGAGVVTDSPKIIPPATYAGSRTVGTQLPLKPGTSSAWVEADLASIKVRLKAVE